MARVSARRVREMIQEHRGILSEVAASFDVSRQTVYNWVKKYGLQDIVADARDSIHDIAEQNIFNAVKDGDLDMSKFVLTHMPTRKERWSNRTELTGKDGEALALSPEVVALMARLNIPLNAVAEELEALIRAQAAEIEDDEQLETK